MIKFCYNGIKTWLTVQTPKIQACFLWEPHLKIHLTCDPTLINKMIINDIFIRCIMFGEQWGNCTTLTGSWRTARRPRRCSTSCGVRSRCPSASRSSSWRPSPCSGTPSAAPHSTRWRKAPPSRGKPHALSARFILHHIDRL